MNVLSKIIVPRLLLTIRYVMGELEEAEREETFRLKRIKQKRDKEKYLEAEALKGAGEPTEEKTQAQKKELIGQSIQPKAEPVAPKSPPDIPMPVAEGGDLAVILPPGDITDPGDIFLPPRGFAGLESINEVEELIDEEIAERNELLEADNREDEKIQLEDDFRVDDDKLELEDDNREDDDKLELVNDDRDDDDKIESEDDNREDGDKLELEDENESLKFGESFETGEWFEQPSEDFEKSHVVEEKEEMLDFASMESKVDDLSRSTEFEEPLESDRNEGSDLKVDGDEIIDTESDPKAKDDQDNYIFKTEPPDNLSLLLENDKLETKKSFTLLPEKNDESISSLENPTIKFRETAEALSYSALDFHLDENTDTLESEQVEQDLFQPVLSDLEKEQTSASILKRSNHKSVDKDNDNEIEAQDTEIENNVRKDTLEQITSHKEELYTTDSEQKTADDKYSDYENKQKKDEISKTTPSVNEEILQIDDTKTGTQPASYEPTDDINRLQKETENKTSKTMPFSDNENKKTEDTKVSIEPAQDIPNTDNNILQNDTEKETAKSDAAAHDIKTVTEDINKKTDLGAGLSGKDEITLPKEVEDNDITEDIQKDKDKRESKSESGNEKRKQMMNRPLRILSSDEILEQERQRNIQSETEDKKDDKQPDK